MATVGERLRLLRESSETTLEGMADATGIGRSYLEALERDEIHELPGKAFGKLYIRAYAEVLEFDPQPWIEDYDREQRLVAGVSNDAPSAAPPGSRPVAAAIARWKASRAAATSQPASDAVESTDEVEAIEATGPADAIESGAAPPEHETVPSGAEPDLLRAGGAPPLDPARPARRRAAPVVVLAMAAIAAVVYLGVRLTEPTKDLPPPAASQVPVSPEPTDTPSEPEARSADPTPADSPPPAAAPASQENATTKPSGQERPRTLSVTDFGVGRRVVKSRLEGESDRFAAGERASFLTRVIGGRRGDVIRHVWIRDGSVEQSIPLRLGGSDWGTHSNKTLGRPGTWAVEARDAHGQVLARVEFSCGP